MKHVIAFDVSMGKSYMVIYNGLKKCIYEAEIKHTKPEFEKLRARIDELIEGYGTNLILCSNQLVSIFGNWNALCVITIIPTVF